MARTEGRGRAERILLADVARAHYDEGASNVEIAARFKVSRFRVARMLEDARALGIVTVVIRDPRSANTDREDDLARLLGVGAVKIVEGVTGSPGTEAEQIGIAIVDLLEDMVMPGMTLGIAWSRTLDLAARLLPDLPRCDVVQLAGILQLPGSDSLPRIITQLGQHAGVTTYPIYAPLVVGEKSTADDVMSQPEIAEALARMDSLDLAVVAIGGWAAEESSVWEKVSPGVREECATAGAVAEISGRLLGVDGSAVHTALDDRLIGVTLDQVRRARTVIACARGRGRVDAVDAAVRSGVIDVLVIDGSLATALLTR